MIPPGSPHRRQGGAAFRVDAEEVSVRRDRLHPAASAKHGDASVREALLRGCPHHADEADQALLGTQKLGDADRHDAPGTKQGQGGAGGRKLAVIMLRMLKDNVPFNPAAKPANGLKNTEDKPVFGAGHPHRALPEAKSLRRDDGPGQVVTRVVDASNDVITPSADWPTCFLS